MRREIALTSLLLGGALWSSCIQSTCTSDADCLDGQVCDMAAQTCADPECVTADDCADGQICEENTCFDVGECGEVPTAPSFCAQDLNPSSSTSGQDICVPEGAAVGAGLFFGSISCDHCKAIYGELGGLAAELSADGHDPMLVFVQIAAEVAGPADIQAALSGATGPVVQDSTEIDIWGSYGSDWYEFVVVDSQGCISERFGPLAVGDVPGSQHDDIATTWVTAMQNSDR